MKRIKNELGAVPSNTILWVLAIIGIVVICWLVLTNIGPN